MASSADKWRDDFDAAARAHAVAQCELGDAHWATAILNAYFDPEDELAAECLAQLKEGESA